MSSDLLLSVFTETGICLLDSSASGITVLQRAAVSHCKAMAVETSLSLAVALAVALALSNIFLFPEKGGGEEKMKQGKGGKEWRRRK